jgi:hypothetical protein
VVVSAAWGERELVLGEGDATMSAQVGNIADGTSASFEIKDRDGRPLGTVNATVSGGGLTAQWTPELPAESPPEVEFEVTAQGESSTSGILKLLRPAEHWVAERLLDDLGAPLVREHVSVLGADGVEVGRSVTDDEGFFAVKVPSAARFMIRVDVPAPAISAAPSEAAEANPCFEGHEEPLPDEPLVDDEDEAPEDDRSGSEPEDHSD